MCVQEGLGISCCPVQQRSPSQTEIMPYPSSEKKITNQRWTESLYHSMESNPDYDFCDLCNQCPSTSPFKSSTAQQIDIENLLVVKHCVWGEHSRVKWVLISSRITQMIILGFQLLVYSCGLAQCRCIKCGLLFICSVVGRAGGLQRLFCAMLYPFQLGSIVSVWLW